MTNEDTLMLEIVSNAIDKDLTDKEAVTYVMKEFATVYKEKVENHEFEADQEIMDMVMEIIPHEFL